MDYSKKYHYINLNRVSSIKFFSFFCRYFKDVAEFIGQAISSGNKIFVNCVFGRSRSTTCVVAYLMLCQQWTLQSSLNHIRRHRPIEVNYGFINQLVDLENKLEMIGKFSRKDTTNVLVSEDALDHCREIKMRN